MGLRKDMVGQVIGRLTVIEPATSDPNGNSRWRCHCECGNKVEVLGFALRNGRTQSCGCYAEGLRNNLMAKADVERRLYTRKSWEAMLGRCYDPKRPAYIKYGARGVTVCDRWRYGENGKTGWVCFFEDMGPKPFGHSIDRIDGTKGYYPENCRWATRTEQRANRTKRR